MMGVMLPGGVGDEAAREAAWCLRLGGDQRANPVVRCAATRGSWGGVVVSRGGGMR